MVPLLIASAATALVLAVVLVWVVRSYLRERARVKAVETRFKGILDVDAEIAARRAAQQQAEKEFVGKLEAYRNEANNQVAAGRAALAKAEQEHVKTLEAIQASKLQVEKDIENLRGDYKEKHGVLDRLKAELALLEEAEESASFGIYKPAYTFDAPERYKEELERIRDRQKALIKEGRVATCDTQWQVGGSLAAGKRMTAHYTKLMTRAFNGECDALISGVRWNNVERIEERIRSSLAAINKLGKDHQITITDAYLELKLAEMRLVYEYAEKVQQAKEEQRQIQAQIREEEKAQREIERALKEAEDEEMRYAKALEQARATVESAKGQQLEKLNDKIAHLEQQLQDAQQNKARAISQAQLTKSGHVYVISNVGSFGENVYKIGMTRRLEPMDRVRELGDASVPFEFDVHAIIYSENAPALENALQKAFHESRLNLVNLRKEFFRVTLPEIEKVAKQQMADIEFTQIAEAREFRESMAMRERRSIPPAIDQPQQALHSADLPESLD